MNKKGQADRQFMDKIVVGAVITTIIAVLIPTILSGFLDISGTGIALTLLFSLVVGIILSAKLFMFLVEFFSNNNG